MNNRPIVLIAGLLALVSSLQAHDVITTNLTFSRDISRIFATRCNSCHGSGSDIPLTTYQEARPWAVSIKEQVLSRAMPPWGAVKGFGNLSPDHGLTQEEIMIIAGWVEGGAPEGDRATLPKPSPHSDLPARPALEDALVVQTQAKLSKAIEAQGIKPLENGKVGSAKVIAHLPSGEIVPLLWLYDFDGTSKRVFTFRAPVELPAGTTVSSSAPLQFALETPIDRKLQSDATGTVKTTVFTTDSR